MERIPSRVTASPDLHIRYRGQEKLLKFEFAAEVPDERSFRILAQGTFAAAEAANLELKPSAICVFDVPRGGRYEASRAKSAIGREIGGSMPNNRRYLAGALKTLCMAS